MKLLIVSQYFYPESFIINDVARTLAEQGHAVTVLTGKPNYPDGRIFAGYRAGGIQHERTPEGVEIVRVPLWPRGRGGARNLVLNYLSFVVSGLLLSPWILRGRSFDAALVFAPSPLTQAIPAILIKWIKRMPLAIWVQDLWPESLAATGFVRSRPLLHAVGWMVKAIYAQADLLLLQSRAFTDSVRHYAPIEKLVYFPNLIDSRLTQSSKPLPASLAPLFENAFTVVFAGNVGTAQAVETIATAAELLKREEAVRLIVIGSGSRLNWLNERKTDRDLHNLHLPGRFAPDVMPAVFSRASALLVSLKDEAIFAQTVPSKVQAYLAAGRPIIAAIRGEGARIVAEAGAGEACPPEDPHALAELVRRFSRLPETHREAMGIAGRAYFDRHFEMHPQVERLANILMTCNKESKQCV